MGTTLVECVPASKDNPFREGTTDIQDRCPQCCTYPIYTGGGQTVTTPVDKSYIPVFVQSLTQPYQQLQ